MYAVAVIVTTNPPTMRRIISIEAVNPLNLLHTDENPGFVLQFVANCSMLWKTQKSANAAMIIVANPI